MLGLDETSDFQKTVAAGRQTRKGWGGRQEVQGKGTDSWKLP